MKSEEVKNLLEWSGAILKGHFKLIFYCLNIFLCDFTCGTNNKDIFFQNYNKKVVYIKYTLNIWIIK